VENRVQNVPQITHYRFSAFRSQKHSAFPRITELPFARIVQQTCSQRIAASGILQSLPSVFFVVRLPKNGVVVLQSPLTSMPLPHSKCHVISLVDAMGFNMYNRCHSHTDNCTKPIMFNSCDTGRYRCRMTAVAAVAVATDRHNNLTV